MIDPTDTDIGRKVVYRDMSGHVAEVGTVTSFNDTCVFVRYGRDKHSKGTRREDLAWVKFLRASCGRVYWEDAEVNGKVDEDGSLIPCRKGDLWCPVIDLAEGRIVDWPHGTTASIHYKVCDEGIYELLDADGKVACKRDGYVIKMMCPQEDGYGDYVIMNVGADGVIANWKVDLSDFEER